MNNRGQISAGHHGRLDVHLCCEITGCNIARNRRNGANEFSVCRRSVPVSRSKQYLANATGLLAMIPVIATDGVGTRTNQSNVAHNPGDNTQPLPSHF